MPDQTVADTHTGSGHELYSQPIKRSDALQHVAATAAALCDALAGCPPLTADDYQPVLLAHGGVAHALHELARSRGRTPGTTIRKAAGPRTERDARGYKRPEQTQPGAGQGRVPGNRGRTYDTNPPTSTDILALIHMCPDTPAGRRLKAAILFSWRTACRVSETMAVTEADLDPQAGSVVIRRGKGGKRRVIGMDPFGWQVLAPWLLEREEYPPGPVFCVIDGPTAGRGWSPSCFRENLRKLQAAAGVRRRIAPHQFRHAWAIEAYREGMPMAGIMRQLGHANMAVTTVYLQGLTNDEIVERVQARGAPQVAIPDLMAMLGNGQAAAALPPAPILRGLLHA